MHYNQNRPDTNTIKSNTKNIENFSKNIHTRWIYEKPLNTVAHKMLIKILTTKIFIKTAGLD